jgi:hypothetical protein
MWSADRHFFGAEDCATFSDLFWNHSGLWVPGVASGAALGVDGGWGDGSVSPDRGASPGAGHGEIDAIRSGSAVGGQGSGETVSEGRKGRGEGEHTGGGSHAGEVEGVAGGVEVAVEQGGVFAPQIERDG